MKTVIIPKARDDLEKLEKDLRTEIIENIEDLETDPLPENSYVIPLIDNTEIQVLKLQEDDRNSKLNHRITYDIIDNDYIRIYGIFERGPGYKEIKKETTQRKH